MSGVTSIVALQCSLTTPRASAVSSLTDSMTRYCAPSRASAIMLWCWLVGGIARWPVRVAFGQISEASHACGYPVLHIVRGSLRRDEMFLDRRHTRYSRSLYV